MSKGMPAEPSSETMRPQYGSAPKSEHWTSIESATLPRRGVRGLVARSAPHLHVGHLGGALRILHHLLRQ